jgi:outer membrane protein W
MKTIKTVLILLVMSVAAMAQGQINFNYQVTLPAGETSDYIDKISFRGFGLEWRKAISKDISAGVSLNWNVFNQVVSEVAELEDGHVSGSQNRTINSFPLLATAHYYLGSKKTIRPFFGMGIGAALIKQKLAIGVYAAEESNWHFAVAPEIGVQFPFSYDALFMISAKYNYAFEADGMTHSYYGLSLAIGTAIF